MASIQCKKTNNQIQNTTYHQKPTITEACHNKNHTTNTHEHTLSDKVKDMAHSARKLFHHHEPDHTQKPTGNCSCGLKKKKEKRMVKNLEGHERHCMPNMLDRLKNLKTTKNKEQKYSDSSSDSDNETTKNKVA